jgi:uncharacterized phage protein (TIGR01671 family)
MREIKFRVWDIKNKMFRKENQYDNLDGISICGKYLMRYVDGCDWHQPRGDKSDIENYIFQQYTGLKDKNSVEIYEGDILERVGSSGSFCKIVVKWADRECCFVYDTTNNPQGSPTPLHDNFVNLCDWTYMVVGNIYENPKLLK